MKISLTDQIKLRTLKLLDRWQNQTEIVRDDIESYMCGYNISKVKISKDVSDMKYTFSQINAIMKEIK